MAPRMHRWVIDSIAEGVAAIEVDGDGVVRLPQWVLPRGAAEGQVLSVEHDLDPEGTRSALRITIDREATDSARAASAAQTRAMRRESGRRDPGGDITL